MNRTHVGLFYISGSLWIFFINDNSMAQNNICFSSWLYHRSYLMLANQAVPFVDCIIIIKTLESELSWQFSWWCTRQNRAQPAFPQLYWHHHAYYLKWKIKQANPQTFVCHVGRCHAGSRGLFWKNPERLSFVNLIITLKPTKQNFCESGGTLAGEI